MFNWIKRQVADFRAAYQENRIAADFPRYKEAKREEHRKAAMQRFSTAELEQDISQRMKDVQQEARRIYGDEISRLERDVSLISSQMAEQTARLEIFAPDYVALMRPLKEEARQLHERKKELYSKRDRAYEDAKSAKDSLDSWYAKSERSGWLMGNKGQKLPQSSFFGQSLNDRDSYKSDLSRAGDQIQSAKREIGSIKNRLDAISSQIGQLQEKRDQVAELRRQGIYPDKIQKTIDAMRRQQEHQRSRLSEVSAKRARLLEEAKQRLGVVPIEKRILEIKLQMDDFIRSFDSPANEAILRADHREQWINAHGR